MALHRIDDAQVRDATTGELLQGLRGRPVTVVTRDTTTPFPIYDGAGVLIPGSVVTVTQTFAVPRIWVDDADAPGGVLGDLYLDWYDAAGGVRGPVDFDATLRASSRAAATSAAAAATASAAAQTAAEAAASAANAARLPMGGTTGQALIKASNADRDATWGTVGGGSGGTTVHGALSGLSADDHPQYHNDARGDVRYYLRATVDSLVATAATQTSAADRARGNHTGTQAISTITNLESRLASLEASNGGAATALQGVIYTGTAWPARPVVAAGLVTFRGPLSAGSPAGMLAGDVWEVQG